MHRDRHKRLYSLHSWIGILLGLFLYVVAFTGTAAMFAEEIKSWENPALRAPFTESPITIEPQFQTVVDDLLAIGDIDHVRMDFPRHNKPYFHAYGQAHDVNDDHIIVQKKWNAQTGESLPIRGLGLSEWVLDFHRNLMLPRTLGRSIVGIAGIVMMLLILTGILIHGKIIKDFFTLRLTRSQRLKWQDSHKVMGIFGLPFFTVMSFTGAFLGVIALLAQVIAVIAFQGDVDALVAKALGAPLEPSGVAAQMLTMDEVYQMRHPETGDMPYRAILNVYGDQNAQFDIYYDAQTQLVTFDQVQISGITGAAINKTLITQPRPAERVVNAMSLLHYGTFGGIIVKWLYVALGIGMCVLIATGLMLWVERRQHGSLGSKSDRFYASLSKINVGVCLGFPLATIAIFYHDKLYLGAEPARLYWTGVTYFAIVFVVILFAMVRSDQYKTVRTLMTGSGILLLGLPILNIVMTGSSHIWRADMSAWVDVSFVVLGVTALMAATQIPKRRNQHKPPKRTAAQEPHKDPKALA